MTRPIIFLHGALGSGAQMQPLAQLEPGTVVCPDFYGHGALASDENPYRIAAFAAQIAESMEDGSTVFGYSMGGYVALYLAAKYPSKVRKVITLATKFDWNPISAAAEVRMMNPDKVLEKIPAFAKQLEMQHGAYWPKVMHRTAVMMLEMGELPPLTADILAKVQAEVVLLRGDVDTMVGAEETKWAQSKIYGAAAFELPNQPHVLAKMNLELVAHYLV